MLARGTLLARLTSRCAVRSSSCPLVSSASLPRTFCASPLAPAAPRGAFGAALVAVQAARQPAHTATLRHALLACRLAAQGAAWNRAALATALALALPRRTAHAERAERAVRPPLLGSASSAAPPSAAAAQPPSSLALSPAPHLLKWAKLLSLASVALLLESLQRSLGWAFALVAALLTRPQPDSVWAYLELRRAQNWSSEPSAARRLLRAVDPSTSVASVSVLDCKAFALAEVQYLNERLTLLGIFGDWFTLASATSSVALPATRALQAANDWAREAAAGARRAAESAGVPPQLAERLTHWPWRLGEVKWGRLGEFDDSTEEDHRL